MYKVKFGGKKGKTIQLEESPDMVAIRTTGNRKLEDVGVSQASKELIDDSTEVAAFPEAGVTVRRVAPSDDGLESMRSRRDETRAALKQEDNIRFAGRVLQDAKSGEAMLYTENIFVKFKDTVPQTDCLAVIARYNLRVKNKLTFATNSYFVQTDEGTGLKVFEIAEKLLAEKQVELCHPELVSERGSKSVHPMQWHLAKTKIGLKTVDAHIDIEKAWQHTRGQGITIAVIDDGIDTDHPEFAGRIVHPFDATDNNDNPRPKTPDDKHGTACAGMACAAGLDQGASGTAPEAQLMPIRLSSGLGSMAEANAFVWAADHGADVISCSWGPTDGDWWDPEHPLHQRVTGLPDSTRLALEYALTKGRGGKGCVILFAAGNGNELVENDGYASYPGVISVAACNDSGKRSVYSDFGEAVWVSFPSGDFGWDSFKHPPPVSTGLRTTDRRQKDGYTAEDYTDSFGGTSGACPGMAGVVALMLAANPALTATELKTLLAKSCRRLDAKEGRYDAQGHSTRHGYGRIDAGLAVENALQAAKATQEGPLVTGTIRFSGVGDIPLKPAGLTAPTPPARKVLGIQLDLHAAPKGLRLIYKVNVPGLGILESKNEGEYVGAANGRQRVIGFAVELEGPSAKKFELEYAARLKGAVKPAVGQNGVFCGSDKKTGKTLEAVSVALRKKEG